MIFSGDFAATVSISTPPSVLATISRCGRGSIEQNRKINFARDLRRLRDKNFIDDATLRACLMRHQSLSEHLRRDIARFAR